MERSKLALAIITLDLRNAKARQRSRKNRGGIQALAIGNALLELSHHLRKLRKEITLVEKLEAREVASRKQDRNIRDRSAGVNIRLTGTYGKS